LLQDILRYLRSMFLSKKSTNYIIWVVLCAAMLWFKLSHHELWKDEWQAYLVARDMSIGEMFSFLNYEGHPALWYLYLKVVSLFAGVFSESQETLIQLGHMLLVAGTTFVLIVRINVPLVVKLGITLSYFVGFQYGIVNRGYILVILFSLLSVVEIKKPTKDSWQLPLYLFLLCQTEVYGVFMAGGLLLYKYSTTKGNIFKTAVDQLYLSASLLVGFLVFVITVWPRGNRDDFTRAYNQQLFDENVILSSFQGNTTNAFLPGLIQDTNQAGWSTIGLLLAAISAVLIFITLRKSKAALISMSAMALIMIVFGVLIYSGGIRQWGMTYIFWVCAICLVADKAWLTDKLAVGSFVIISMAQLVHNGRAIARDYTLPFSISEQVGVFIKEKVPKTVPVIAINKFETAAVGAYADRPLYELPSGASFTYFKWLEKVYIPTQSELDLFTRFKGVGGSVLISPRPIDLQRFSKAKLWQTFEDPTYKLERMYLYSVPLK